MLASRFSSEPQSLAGVGSPSVAMQRMRTAGFSTLQIGPAPQSTRTKGIGEASAPLLAPPNSIGAGWVVNREESH